MSKYNLLSEHEWLGEFWSPDSQDEKYPGLLKYSPREGVNLYLQIPFSDDSFENNSVIHGYSQSLGFLSLMECIVINSGSTNFATKNQTIFANYLVIGENFTSDDNFDRIIFELSNFREFCHPQGFKLNDEYHRQPIGQALLNDITVSLQKNATGSYVSPDEISKLIWIDKDHASYFQELNEASSIIAKKHKIKTIYRKNNIGTQLEIKAKQGMQANFKFYMKHYYSLVSLFQLLIKKITIPVYISLVNEKGGHDKSYSVLPSLLLSDKDIRYATKDISYHFLTIKVEDVLANLKGVLLSWNDIYSDPSDFVLSTLQEHIVGSPNPIQHTVLLISALEQWFYKYESNSDKGHYDYMFDKYSTKDLNRYFELVSPVKKTNNKSLGQVLTSIRGLILHPQQQKEKAIDDIAYSNVSEVVFVILLRAIYTKLGFSQEVVDKLGEGEFPVYKKHSLVK